jgi:hypothetical protein
VGIHCNSGLTSELRMGVFSLIKGLLTWMALAVVPLCWLAGWLAGWLWCLLVNPKPVFQMIGSQQVTRACCHCRSHVLRCFVSLDFHSHGWLRLGSVNDRRWHCAGCNGWDETERHGVHATVMIQQVLNSTTMSIIGDWCYNAEC